MNKRCFVSIPAANHVMKMRNERACERLRNSRVGRRPSGASGSWLASMSALWASTISWILLRQRDDISGHRIGLIVRQRCATARRHWRRELFGAGHAFEDGRANVGHATIAP